MATQLRRRKAVKGLLDGKSVKDSLLSAGYARSTATQNPGEILKGLQAEFAEALDGMLPREEMIATLLDGLTATKTTYVYNPKLGITESFDQPDHFARVKCAELLSKLGGLVTRKEEVNVSHSIEPSTILAARRRAEQAQAAVTAEVVRELPAPTTPENISSESDEKEEQR